MPVLSSRGLSAGAEQNLRGVLQRVGLKIALQRSRQVRERKRLPRDRLLLTLTSKGGFGQSNWVILLHSKQRGLV